MRRPIGCLLLVLLVAGSLSLVERAGADESPPAATGPDTEQRFPPLKVPEGFKATLFACDPLIEYPSVISVGPRLGSLFVGIDYMTGLGTGIERRSEVRLIADTNGDGYADKATVFAGGFNSIQGLTWHAQTLYVMHSPYLTALRDTSGDGQADERRDLVSGLGLSPEQDQFRLHNANGIVAGHDGWLYLALGDHGCNVLRPEGDRLVLEGGGILRCRPDGRDLHIFATGLRNIYDVALDDELNVFVRDNENDGGDYKIRVCHSFFGADHGYPYLYSERPAESIAPLADLGLGSSAGGAAYLERQFPPDFRGNLFFCEWGRAVVRYPLQHAGPSFAALHETDFAAGNPQDPYGFKPTDLAVDQAGSMFVSDWADGQRPRRGRGRIYLIRHVNGIDAARKPDQEQGPSALDSESHFQRIRAQAALIARGEAGRIEVAAALEQKKLGVRGRLHAVWILAHDEPQTAIPQLLALAKTDPDPRVAAQAIRAIADLADPVLASHRLDAGRGDANLAEQIASLAASSDSRVVLEAVIAMGRLRWANAPRWLDKNIVRPDPALAHAAQWTLRRSGNWPAILKLLDKLGQDSVRDIALRAVAEQYDPTLVDGLIERLQVETDAKRRIELSDALTRVHRKPAPWTYWGFRPPPRPANSALWERTEAIEQALDRVLADPDSTVRAEVLRRMLREKIPARTSTLGSWLAVEHDPERAAALLAALRDRPTGEISPLMESVTVDRSHAATNRLLAASILIQCLDKKDERLFGIAIRVEDGPVLAQLLRAVGTHPSPAARLIVLQKLSSSDALVRAAALEAAGGLKIEEAGERVVSLLSDVDPQVRAAAALAAGKLAHRAATELLLALVDDPNAEVRRATLDALRRLGEPRAIRPATAALGDDETVLPALALLGELGGADQGHDIAQASHRQPSVEVLTSSAKVLTGWAARKDLSLDERHQIQGALADIHGSSGAIVAWNVWSPLSQQAAKELMELLAAGREPSNTGRVMLSAGGDAPLSLGMEDGDWLATCELNLPAETLAIFFTGSTGLETVWLNGSMVHERKQPAPSGAFADRFEVTLPKGTSRIVVRLTEAKKPAEFQLRFRHKSASSDHERLVAAALSRAGNLDRGRKIFLNADKSLCLKCHRLGDQGERVGPELTGLGSRFSRIHIVESILEPSRAVATSFQTTLLALADGRRLSGIQIAQTDAAVTIVDSEARQHTIDRSDIETIRKVPNSAMPDGLEKKLSEDEFVDLVSFLASLTQKRGP